MEKITADLSSLQVEEDSTADRKLLIAVDFGTTFSGVAWAQTRRVSHFLYKMCFGVCGLSQLQQPDVQSVIIQWPDATTGGLEGVSSDKVPT